MSKDLYKKIIEMEDELEIINLSKLNTTGNNSYLGGGMFDGQLDQATYDQIKEIDDKDLDRYLKIRNAYNIEKTKSYVKFFFVLAVIGIVISIIAILPALSTIIQLMTRATF